VATEYVAFCDDDTWWQENSLSRAAAVLDGSPEVAVLCARVLGFLACASVFRTEVFRRVGGYEPKLFIGGEEELIALDVLASGLAIVYAEELVVHHYPSALRDSALRRHLLARNAAWVAWLRLPLCEASRATLRALLVMLRERTLLRGALTMFAALPWALAQRRVIPPRVQRMRAIVLEGERPDL
jgi:GT2 family glycosyltransferase